MKIDACPKCGVDFAEFPEMKHDADECDGPECTCYEITGGHQPGCPYGASMVLKGSLADQRGITLE